MGKKHARYAKEQCSLKADIIYQFQEHLIPFDVFSAGTYLDGFVKLLADESNLYAQQNGREFHINKQEMRAFLGINYIVSINKTPTIQSYWECGQFLGNDGIRNVMDRSRFEDILQNLHFSDNTKDEKSDKGYKIRSFINNFNQSFSNPVSNGDSQNIDEHMVKFKGRSSMKQFVKSKPIKCGFKFWYSCASETGYLY